MPEFCHAFAVSVSGVAGALNAPILTFGKDGIDQRTHNVILSLSPHTIYILSTTEEYSLCLETCQLEPSRFTTNRIPRVNDPVLLRNGIIHFGTSNNMWKTKTALIGQFSDKPNVFIAAPYAYKHKLPFILADDDTMDISKEHKASLNEANINRLIVIGEAADSTLVSSLRIDGFLIECVSDPYLLYEKQDFCFNQARQPKSVCIGSRQDSHFTELLSTPALCATTNSILILEDPTDLNSEVKCIEIINRINPDQILFIQSTDISELDRKILSSFISEEVMSCSSDRNMRNSF